MWGHHLFQGLSGNHSGPFVFGDTLELKFPVTPASFIKPRNRKVEKHLRVKMFAEELL